ncbi:MAG TPA: tetratricopeptide repeat protein [Steroidobacteraceae bacterium]|nr:tetratricopeptide repeat protein [Steroidobacteraceae bacterium]
MKVRVLRALSASAVLVVAAAMYPAAVLAAEKGQQPSAKLAKPLHEAQEDLKAKKYNDAIAKLKEAEGLAGKTPYDQHVINEFLGNAYINTQNYAEASKVMEAEVDDGFTPESEKPQMLRALTELNTALKNYDKVVEYGNRALKVEPGNERMRALVGQAYYLKGDYKNSLKFVENDVDSQIKAGQTPKKDTLLLLYSSCQKLNDDNCSTHAMEKLVAYYPQPDYWSQLLGSVRSQTSNNDADLLQTYRLMTEVDVLKTPADYNEMAQLALEAGSPGEAQSVLEKGFQKEVFNDKLTKDRNQRLLDNAKKAAASDQASLPNQVKEADASSSGQKNVGVGLAFLGYGQYDKAADELSKGLTKGGVKDEAQARLLLGIAQLKSGHKDEAVKSFKSVKGDPNLERLANLWTLHAKQA